MDALGTGMKVVVDDQTMKAVTEVGAARLMRLKLHRFRSFGDGGALIFE